MGARYRKHPALHGYHWQSITPLPWSDKCLEKYLVKEKCMAEICGFDDEDPGRCLLSSNLTY
jgi:hypothetical protein